jgi:hypothetical protein
MIDASLWARKLAQARDAAVERDPELGTGFQRRAEDVVREVQLDAIRQALRTAQEIMDAARPGQRHGLGKVVDAISDLALVVAAPRPKRGT